MPSRGIARTLLVGCLTAGLLLTCACMLFVCPLVAAAHPPAESCHSVPHDHSDPVKCPYAVVQLVYAAPIVDIAVDHPVVSPGVVFQSPAAARPFAEFPSAAEGDRATARSGPDRHARLCVFRI
jgi:hypothetical protein